MKHIILCLFVSIFGLHLNLIHAQKSTHFQGVISNPAGELLVGAIVFWENQPATAVVADSLGKIRIQRIDTLQPYKLEINYTGYASALIEILPDEDNIRILVSESADLKTVVVEADPKGNFTSAINPINVETITACELKRGACCSVAESFETNGAVNVSASDAVTGSKDIEMLGLKGAYLQMQIENRPALNRSDRIYGLEFIPGSWVEGIQISKGASTVRNGVQGITGQINLQLLKPNKAPTFFLNLYGNRFGRFELNTHLNTRINEQLGTITMLHTNYFQTPIDHNHDGFLDQSLKKQINLLHRWFYTPEKWHMEFNVHGLLDERNSGQHTQISEHFTHPTKGLYLVNSSLQRLEGFGKIGYLGSPRLGESVALMYSGLIYNQKMRFGDRIYTNNQRNLYLNGLYQTNLFDSKAHFLVMGLNHNIDKFEERFDTLNLDRTEQLTSVFGEYDFSQVLNNGHKFGFLIGARADVWQSTKSGMGLYYSPRANLYYNFSARTVVRASAGRGVRMPNTLAENVRYMASSRQFIMQNSITPELAWNYGVNLTHNFQIGRKDASLQIDMYRTDFQNQLIANLDRSQSLLVFQNSTQKSFANSLLVVYSQDLFKGLNLRFAYKYNDARAYFDNKLELLPFTPQHRGLVTAGYKTPNKRWQFDLTFQLVGQQRLPYTNAKSPNYVLGLGQVTYMLKKNWDFYIGGENITNYRQANPIIDAANPFGTNFDAGQVYAPVMGAMYYAGLRFTFDKKDAHKEEHGDDDHHEGEHTHLNEVHTSAQCGMCKTKLETKIGRLKGVVSVNLNMETNVLEIETKHGTNLGEIRTFISNLGYDADDVKANPKAYDKLPACCKK